MFEKLIRELEELEGTSVVSLPVKADENGYLDKECPAPKCAFAFKVLDEHWVEKFRDEAVFCPRCGHTDTAESWATTEQIEQAKGQIVAMLQSRIDGAIEADAHAFNANQPRRGFLRMSMTISGTAPQHVMVPLAAAAVLQQQLVCAECGAGYAVLGPAFFCPCCGHNSADQMFERALAKVRTKIEGIHVVRDALRASTSADDAETFCRSTIEGGLQDCVVAFQFLAERLYISPSGSKRPGLNAFQRLDGGSDLWRATIGKGYDDWLDTGELRELTVLFQRRHLLAHRDGIVDDKYVQKSADTTYRVGQRVVVVAADVLRMAALVEKLGAALRAAAARPSP